MFKSVSIVAVGALLIVGCGDQRGRFSTSGGGFRAFSENRGFITIVDGYDRKPTRDVDRQEQHLLYLIYMCSGGLSGSSSDYGQYVTTLNYRWNTSTGTFVVSVRWDRQADTVAIGKQKFIREKGNVFVVRLDADREVVGQQLKSLGPHADFQQVLKHAREQLANDKLMASLKLQEH